MSELPAAGAAGTANDRAASGVAPTDATDATDADSAATSAGLVRFHVLVRGLVQGVWFRESTRHEATRLGVCGWVRNLPDGRVEAVFEGPPAPGLSPVPAGPRTPLGQPANGPRPASEPAVETGRATRRGRLKLEASSTA